MPKRRSRRKDRRRELTRGSQLVFTARELAVELPASKLAEDLPDARRLDESERNQIGPADLELDVPQPHEVLAQHRSVVTREGEERRIWRERLDERNDPGGVELLRAQPLDDPRGDRDRTDDALDVSTTHLQTLQPVVRLLRGELARERREPEPPDGNLDAELGPQLQRPREELRGLLVASLVRVHGVICVEITEPPDPLGGTRILEQGYELVA